LTGRRLGRFAYETAVFEMDNERSDELLAVDNLKTTFRTMRGRITAVDGVSFKVNKGEILGVVGESGCGKSVTSQSIMRLYDEKESVAYEGRVIFENENLLEKSERDMEKVRGNGISMIFQDALSSLNPLYTVGNQISEAVMRHKNVSRREAAELAEEMLRRTGIPSPKERAKVYPHEMSGGMRQRAMIAMALACRPKVLIADEPTTALDVTIQAQILKLITDLNGELGMGVIFITHDLGVVFKICDRIVIMYLGHIVEEGLVRDIFERPLHPYTAGLIKSMPTLGTKRGEKLYMIKGSVPAFSEIGDGCRYCGRCPHEGQRCRESDPELTDFNATQRVRCHCAAALRDHAEMRVAYA
jgi:oligopeptide/dipeptide ABC transporter ATP-binding protein